jgi:hypothetical protein
MLPPQPSNSIKALSYLIIAAICLLLTISLIGAFLGLNLKYASVTDKLKYMTLFFLLYSPLPMLLIFILSMVTLFSAEDDWTRILSRSTLLFLLFVTVIINTLSWIIPDSIFALNGLAILAIPVIHIPGILIAIVVGYQTYHFDKNRYSHGKKALLAISWLIIWMVTMFGYLIASITVYLLP